MGSSFSSFWGLRVLGSLGLRVFVLEVFVFETPLYVNYYVTITQVSVANLFLISCSDAMLVAFKQLKLH